MNIPFLSFSKINEPVRQEISACFETFIDEHYYILGSRVKKFEAKYAAYCGTGFCCGVANGLDALILALKALNIQVGDEVIVPSNTYIATWLAVSAVGARVVPVEPNDATFNIDPSLIEAAITPATKAIMPVHLYGQACEMDAVMQLAKKHELYVVEDNAQAQGATYNGKCTGSFGHINGTSFYPGKNLGAYGDAGAVTTDDASLLERVQSLRNYGSKVKYYNDEQGCNSRLDELQAGLLSIKLRYLDAHNAERKEIAKQYDAQLADIPSLRLPQLANGADSVYHQYVVRTDKRDELMQYLKEKGVGTLIHYPVPPHLQKAYGALGYKQGDFPIAEKIALQCISLPIYPGLTAAEIEYICQNIRAFLHG